jgi:signal transduction histidine kinase
VRGAPWALLVEMRRAAVTGPQSRLLGRLSLLAVAVVVVTAAAAWWLGRRITRPLHQAAAAAEAIAAGRPSPRLPVNRADEIGRFSAAFNTMADRVERSQARLEADVAERTRALRDTLQELEAFSYSVSHDLRAPLRAMQGFAQALLEDSGDELGETGRDYARRVVDAARRLDALIQDLLAYSRLSREELALGVVDLDALVADAVRTVDTDVRARGGRVTVDGPLGRARANTRMLAQVLVNLLGNALKFVAPPSAPAVRVRAELCNGGGRVRLWVEDNGIGIAPEHQERIFRVFERLHGGETYPGTGIGLAIVARGMERMAGAAGVVSAPGEGSRFWIELPAEAD